MTEHSAAGVVAGPLTPWTVAPAYTPPLVVETHGSHYVVDGRAYVRVTTICAMLPKPFLLDWVGRVGNAEAKRVRDQATEFGKRLHTALQAFASNPTDGGWAAHLAPDLEPFAYPFLDWWWSNVQTVIAPERLLISRQCNYAGTTDLVAVLQDGQVAVVDWKSSKAYPQHNPQPDPAWRLQTAAYVAALQEQDGLVATRRLVVQLPTNQPGACYVHEFDATGQAADFLAFRCFLNGHRWQEGLKT